MHRSVLAFAAAMLVAVMTPGAALTQESDSHDGPLPPLLVILAHPDDEVIIAPALARIARTGREVRIAFATSGDAGPGESGLEPGTALARLREEEARCSARALGIAEPVFWDLGDGKLSILARSEDSPANQALDLIRRAIAQHGPGQVMTFGPDGGYGHSDHRMVSALVSQAVQGMGEARPELLYAAIAEGTLPPIPELQRWATTAPDLISHTVLYEPLDLAAAQAATGCYESQFSAEVRAALATVFDQSIWRGTVKFRSGL
ncbi:PIG-L family deacetylase [Erythrobacter sp. JK5]|uniref:PIG-L family deacetylase n=1 Tax=Erythrobacter sp. JK5 TaxID=2829500 RepID=UPI001BA67143|nr:PIG-L family deacetylase [Erythrobacter sp. JK5]QUL37052.1 PIG-L family deacetylase [Erythrobacter sp. JK5]